MVTLSHITLTELQRLMHTTQIPVDSRLTVIFEDEHDADALLKPEQTADALKRLRGSGNGNLVRTLLRDRARDRSHKRIRDKG